MSSPAFKSLGKLVTEVHGCCYITREGKQDVLDIGEEIQTIRRELQSLKAERDQKEQRILTLEARCFSAMGHLKESDPVTAYNALAGKLDDPVPTNGEQT